MGHNENDPLHTYSSKNVDAVISCKNPESKYYDQMNQYLSEYSAIFRLREEDYKDYKYIGLCHYRTFLLNKLYKPEELAEKSYKYLNRKLLFKDAVISQFECKYPLKYGAARWSGTRTIELVKEWMYAYGLGLESLYDEYLNQCKFSNKSLIVCKREVLFEFIDRLREFSHYSYQRRKELKELYPRSVGYDLEHLFGFFMYFLSMRSSTYVSKRVTIDNGEVRFC